MLDSAVQAASDEYYTLLGVRSDGIASIVDLAPSSDFGLIRMRAQALLREHASCELVEVWRDGSLIEKLARH